MIFIEEHEQLLNKDISCGKLYELEAVALESSVNGSNERRGYFRTLSFQSDCSNKTGTEMRQCLEKLTRDGQRIENVHWEEKGLSNC